MLEPSGAMDRTVVERVKVGGGVDGLSHAARRACVSREWPLAARRLSELLALYNMWHAVMVDGVHVDTVISDSSRWTMTLIVCVPLSLSQAFVMWSHCLNCDFITSLVNYTSNISRRSLRQKLALLKSDWQPMIIFISPRMVATTWKYNTMQGTIQYTIEKKELI